jgi:hypothetical protein
LRAANGSLELWASEPKTLCEPKSTLDWPTRPLPPLTSSRLSPDRLPKPLIASHGDHHHRDAAAMLAPRHRAGPTSSSRSPPPTAPLRRNCLLLSAPEGPRWHGGDREGSPRCLLPQVPNSRLSTAVFAAGSCRRGLIRFVCAWFLYRCTLETAGTGFDPLGLYREGTSGRDSSHSPLSNFFGILSPVFGSSGGGARRGVAGCPLPFISCCY